MKIAIDTATDSKEEIQKAIRLLQSLVEHEGSGSRNIFDSPSPSLFGDSPAQSEPSANPVSAFGSMFGDDAPAPQSAIVELPKKEEKPRIELY